MSVKEMKIHMSTHEMNFVCTEIENGIVCNKRFARKSYLKHHIDRQHLGIRWSIIKFGDLKFYINFDSCLRSHECPHCNASFAAKILLSNHVKTIHEMRRIKCELCATLLTRRDYYRKHIKVNHLELESSTKEEILQVCIRK